MDIVRAIKFPLDDDDWVMKVIVGTLLMFIPFFAPGYQVRVARQVIRGKKRPLPENDELGQVFIDGLVATIAGLVYFLPLILVACVFLFPALAVGDNDLGAFLVCMSAACIMLMALVFAIPAIGLYWMGVIRYAETGDFWEFFRIGPLWGDMMSNLTTLLLLLVYSFVLGLIGAMVSPLAAVTVVGLPLLGFWHQIASGHLLGQAGLEITGR